MEDGPGCLIKRGHLYLLIGWKTSQCHWLSCDMMSPGEPMFGELDSRLRLSGNFMRLVPEPGPEIHRRKPPPVSLDSNPLKAWDERL